MHFQALVESKRNLIDELNLHYSEVELSMGMSSDYEHAVSNYKQYIFS